MVVVKQLTSLPSASVCLSVTPCSAGNVGRRERCGLVGVVPQANLEMPITGIRDGVGDDGAVRIVEADIGGGKSDGVALRDRQRRVSHRCVIDMGESDTAREHVAQAV